MKHITLLLFIVTIILGTGLSNEIQAQSTTDDEVLTITEYSDYQCPACAYFHPMVEKLKEKFGDKIQFDFKYYPLNSHQFAALAARAAEAAKNQGKFYEMHDMLFTNQKRWSSSGNPAVMFVNYAEELELDIEQFKEELFSAEIQKIVMEEKMEGRRAGVQATPTFYIEGKKLDPLPKTYEQFEQIVQKHLKN